MSIGKYYETGRQIRPRGAAARRMSPCRRYYPMKKSIVTSSLCVLTGCLLLLGCSKAKDNKTPSTTPAGNAAAPANGAVEFKIRWTVGKKYVHQIEITQNAETPLPNAPKPRSQATKMGFGYSISVLKELPNGGRELEMEFLSVKMESTDGDRTMLSFDSEQAATANGAKNPVAPLFRRMVGARLKLLTDAAGKVEQVEGFDEFQTRIAGNGGAAMQAAVKSMFSEDTFKQLCDPNADAAHASGQRR